LFVYIFTLYHNTICLIYGGPKGHAMRQYLSDSIYAAIDNIYVTIDDNYATVDNSYVTIDDNYATVDNSYATMLIRQLTIITRQKLRDDWPWPSDERQYSTNS